MRKVFSGIHLRRVGQIRQFVLLGWMSVAAAAAFTALSACASDLLSADFSAVFSDASATNGFYESGRPAAQREFIQWSHESGLSAYCCYMMCANARKTLWGRAVKDFGDVRGEESDGMGFVLESVFSRRTNPALSDGSRGRMGVCALAESADPDSGSWYSAYICYTDGVGRVVISRFDSGAETVLNEAPLDMPYGDRTSRYSMRLEGILQGALSLTCSVSDGTQTNTAAAADANPLPGGNFGLYSLNDSGGAWTYWYSMGLRVWKIPSGMSVVIIR